MPNTDPDFLCLENPNISQFINQDFDLIPPDAAQILTIHDHQIHVSRHPNNREIFELAVVNTKPLSRQISARADSRSILPIITRLAEAVMLGYIEHAAVHPNRNNHSVPE